MSSRDIAEAMAYERLEPYGEARQDYRIGLLGFRMAELKGVKNLKIKDFMPNFERKQETIGDKVKEVFAQWRR